MFHCVSCGHTANADMNAAKVIKHRGIQALQKHLASLEAGTVKATRTKKAVRVRRAAQPSTVGQVVSEPVAEKLLPTLVQSASDAANDEFVYGAMLEHPFGWAAPPSKKPPSTSRRL